MTLRHRGITIDIGGTPYVVPAMSLGIIEDFQTQIDAFEAGTHERPMGLVLDLLHACLRRNYPDLPRELLRDFVDMDNFAELFAVVMGSSGYKRWLESEANAGNERARQTLTTLNGTGAPSMPT